MSTVENKIKLFKSEKFAFYNWVYKWVTNNEKPEEVNVDAPQIVAVLQTLGFKLENIDYTLNRKDILHEETYGSIIEVKCNKSGMRAILSKQSDVCICPGFDIANESHFWTVSGSGPSSSQDKIHETHSTLIPTLSKEKTMIVRDILTKLFVIIESSDFNQNNGHNRTNFQNRVRSVSDLATPIFSRQGTWEIDPDTTPPTETSSPLQDLSRSISQISLNEDKQHMLVDILLNLKDNLEKAFTLLPMKDNTFIKENEKQDIVTKIKSKPRTPVQSVINKSNLNKSFKTIPSQLENKNVNTSSEKRKLVASTRIGALKKKIERITPTRISTIPKNKQLALSVSSAVPDRRKSLGFITNNSNLKTKLNLSGNGPEINGTKPKTGIPSFGLKNIYSKKD